jgi:hypothetical protein
MKMPLLLAVTTLLVASAARFVPAATLSASPNPVIAPAGQTEGPTTLTWKTEGAEGFVRVSVGAGEETLLTDAGAIDGSLGVTAELGKTYVFKLYTNDKEKLLASVSVTVVPQEGIPPTPVQLPPIAPPGRDVYPAYIYALTPDGTLKWYRHDGAQEGKASWQGPREVATGWNKYRFVFPGGGNIIYAITQDGILQWYRHKGFETGLGPEVSDSWEGPNNVGRGWADVQKVFSGGDGIIYAINRDGKLLWFRHNTFLSGAGLEAPGAWEGPKEVGRGWGNLKAVFSTGGGVIYTVTEDGKLHWYKHNGYLNGRGLESPGAWRQVELGLWGTSFKELFSAGSGIIYDLERDGILTWSIHKSYEVGFFEKSPISSIAFDPLNANNNWQGGFPVGNGWAGFTNVFALLPNTDASGGVLPVDTRSVTGTSPGPRPTLNPQPPPRRTPNSVRRASKP